MGLSITVADVQQSNNATTAQGVAGEAITAGVPLVKVANQYYMALIGGDVNYANCHGFAISSAAAGQTVSFVTKDSAFVTGATMTPGTQYALGDSAGAIEALTALSSGDKQVLLYTAVTATVAVLNIHKSAFLIP